MTSRYLDIAKLELRYELLVEPCSNEVRSLQVLLTDDASGEAAHAWGHRVHNTAAANARLDDLVFELVCQQLVAWRSEGYAIPVCIPVGLDTLGQDSTADRWLHLLRDARIDAQSIDLGITPLSALSHGAASNVAKLAKAGLRISLLGFGTGYSSLAMVKVLPVSRLEVCEEHAAGVEADANMQSLLQSTFKMARALELRAAAAGVLSNEAAATLQNLGCEEARGSWASMPLRGSEVVAATQKRVSAVRVTSTGGLRAFLQRVTRLGSHADNRDLKK